MKYLVTGATGFIGGKLARTLIDEGDEVRAFVRDKKSATKLKELGAELHKGDLANKKSLISAMNDVDGVFHLAAIYRVGNVKKEILEKVNVEGTKNVLEAMKEAEVPRGVFTSSLAVFSDTKGKVYDEEYKFQGKHLSVYDLTKWKAHYEVARPMMDKGLPLIIVMPGVVYGKGDTSQMGELIRDYLGGKPQILPKQNAYCFTYIEDVVRGHILAMKKGRAGEEYIISGKPATLKEAFDTLKSVTGIDTKIIWLPGAFFRALSYTAAFVEKFVTLPDMYTAEVLRSFAGVTYLGSNKKAKDKLGYKPRSIKKGFVETFG